MSRGEAPDGGRYVDTADRRPVYPFTAIAGQPAMLRALLLTAVDPALGGVLIRGKKGTAKSTAVRALAALLPELECVDGCPFNCDPTGSDAACDDCRARLLAGEQLPVVRRRAPVVELPIGATEDRVAGSLDLETAIQRGERRFEPGLLARANRGILYMDEVNLLGDHLVDLLLDAAALGRNYVEREGISFSHPARVVLLGTMNPEEGELRPQLLDRFALAVDVDGIADPAVRAGAVRGRIAFERDPAGFVAAQRDAEQAERDRLGAARALLPAVTVPPVILELIVHVCVTFAVDGLRADLALYRAAAALAAYAGRVQVTEQDIREVAPLVLAHRRRRQPFEQPGLDQDQLDRALAEFAGRQPDATPDDPPANAANEEPPQAEPAPPEPAALSNGPPGGASGREEELPDTAPVPQPAAAPAETAGRTPAATPPPAVVPAGNSLPAPRARAPAESTGRGLRAATGRRGGTVRTGAPTAGRRPTELALLPTLAAAAPRQPGRRAGLAATGDGAPAGPAVILHTADLRERIRQGRSGRLVLFVVDASGSMGARQRMAATRSAVLGLLLDAYRGRDHVGLIAFRGSGAELLLPPTNSVDLAERKLGALPAGGRTPVAAGLDLAATVLDRARRGRNVLVPLLVLVSDGRANSAPPQIDPWQAARQAAARLRATGLAGIVLDGGPARTAVGFARTLAADLGAEYVGPADAGDLPALSL